MPNINICAESDCEIRVHAKGLCGLHYQRMRSALGLKPKSKPTTTSANAEQTLRRGGMLNSPRNSPFRVIARSCPRCGMLMTTPDELILKNSGTLPGCRECAIRAVYASKLKRIAADEVYAKKEKDRTYQGKKRAQSLSTIDAYNSGKEWTGPELEIASRYDLTARHVAKLLGRTLYSVKHMRRNLRDDPKTILHVGLSESGRM